MTFTEAQIDMDYAYFGGATGVLVSGLVWCAAGFIGLLHSTQASMYALFIGGMFIFPLGMLMSKACKRPGKHKPENPLNKLALESTIIIFVGLFIAFSVSNLQVTWFYPIMLLAIGVRYLVFNSLYGNRTYWSLGAVMMLGGVYCILFNAHFIVGAFVGGLSEVLFSLVIFNQSKNVLQSQGN